MAIPRSLARRADAPSVPLTKAQAPLLAEALRRGEATRNMMEDALVEYGRWILVNIFQDDAAAALDTKSENPLLRDQERTAAFAAPNSASISARAWLSSSRSACCSATRVTAPAFVTRTAALAASTAV